MRLDQIGERFVKLVNCLDEVGAVIGEVDLEISQIFSFTIIWNYKN